MNAARPSSSVENFNTGPTYKNIPGIMQSLPAPLQPGFHYRDDVCRLRVEIDGGLVIPKVGMLATYMRFFCHSGGCGIAAADSNTTQKPQDYIYIYKLLSQREPLHPSFKAYLPCPHTSPPLFLSHRSSSKSHISVNMLDRPLLRHTR